MHMFWVIVYSRINPDPCAFIGKIQNIFLGGPPKNIDKLEWTLTCMFGRTYYLHKLCSGISMGEIMGTHKGFQEASLFPLSHCLFLFLENLYSFSILPPFFSPSSIAKILVAVVFYGGIDVGNLKISCNFK